MGPFSSGGSTRPLSGGGSTRDGVLNRIVFHHIKL